MWRAGSPHQSTRRRQRRPHRQAVRSRLPGYLAVHERQGYTEGVKVIRHIFAAALSALAVTAAVPVSTANADPTCGTNAALDPATNTCKPIYSTPRAGCNPTTTGDGLACFGGPLGWEESTEISTDDINALVCRNLFLNGVNVGSLEEIYYWLYKPPYNLAGRDAGRSVAQAIVTECPEYKSEAMVVMQQVPIPN